MNLTYELLETNSTTERFDPDQRWQSNRHHAKHSRIKDLTTLVLSLGVGTSSMIGGVVSFSKQNSVLGVTLTIAGVALNMLGCFSCFKTKPNFDYPPAVNAICLDLKTRPFADIYRNYKSKLGDLKINGIIDQTSFEKITQLTHQYEEALKKRHALLLDNPIISALYQANKEELKETDAGKKYSQVQGQIEQINSEWRTYQEELSKALPGPIFEEII